MFFFLKFKLQNSVNVTAKYGHTCDTYRPVCWTNAHAELELLVGQIYKNERYDSGHTLLHYLSRT